jgi:hypothetical protein
MVCVNAPHPGHERGRMRVISGLTSEEDLATLRKFRKGVEDREIPRKRPRESWTTARVACNMGKQTLRIFMLHRENVRRA